MLITEAAFTLRKWTVKEYHKLGEIGIFNPEERLELIEGNILKISAKGTGHASATRAHCDDCCTSLVGTQAAVYE
jgi:Uma2 family endonuclease